MSQLEAVRIRKHSAWYPSISPDYNAEQDAEQINQLIEEGKIVKDFILSPDFGGAEEDLNRIFISPEAALEKARWDRFISECIDDSLEGISFECKLKYLEKSPLLSQFTIKINGPFETSHTVHIFPSVENSNNLDLCELLAQGNHFGQVLPHSEDLREKGGKQIYS